MTTVYECWQNVVMPTSWDVAYHIRIVHTYRLSTLDTMQKIGVWEWIVI